MFNYTEFQDRIVSRTDWQVNDRFWCKERKTLYNLGYEIELIERRVISRPCVPIYRLGVTELILRARKGSLVYGLSQDVQDGVPQDGKSNIYRANLLKMLTELGTH